MKNLNLITGSIKAKKTMTAKDFTAWQREMKKSLKPLELAKRNSEQRRIVIQYRITLTKSCIGELKAANTALKSKAGKTLLKIQQKDLQNAGEETIQLFSKEMIELAKEEARNLNWRKATKILNEAIDFAGVKNNGLLTVKPDATLFLYRAKAQYYQNGIKPALKKGLYEALKFHPKNEALTHAVSHYEILDGKYDAAFKAMQQIPRNTLSRTDTVIRYMLQPHTDHGGLEAFTKEGLLGNPGEPVFGRGGFPGGIDPRGIFPDGPFDIDPFADFNNRPDLGGYFGDLPLLNITNGKPLAFQSNFYCYQHKLVADDFYDQVNNALATDTRDDAPNKSEEEHIFRVFARIHKKWNQALDNLHHRNYSSAIACLEQARSYALRTLTFTNESYVEMFNKTDSNGNKIGAIVPPLTYESNDSVSDLDKIEAKVFKAKFENLTFGQSIIDKLRTDRQDIVDLDSLYAFDWLDPLLSDLVHDVNLNTGVETLTRATCYKPGVTNLRPVYHFLWGSFPANDNSNIKPGLDTFGRIFLRLSRVDFRLIIFLAVFIRFAKIEAYRFSKQYEKALNEIRDLLRMNDGYYVFDKKTKRPKFIQGFNLLNPTIEYPFLKIMQAQILIELADKQYKAGELKTELRNVNSNPKGLVAKKTYDDAIKVFDDWSTYKNRVNEALLTYGTNRNTILKVGGSYKHSSPIFIREMKRLGNPVANILTPDDHLKAQAVNKRIHITNINSSVSTNRTALIPSRNYPWQRAIQWVEGNQNALSNPVIYAINLEATSKLQQIAADLNYLGYRDDYVPPWKFFYLLDRARYYTDQAKNLQRDYLNFLSNAEREQFQEMGAGQSVSLERMNVNVENARVDQANAELEVANQSNELAQLQATNSQARKDNFDDYDSTANDLDFATMILSGGGAIAAGVGAGASIGAVVAGIPTGGAGAPLGAGVGAVAGLAVGVLAAGPGVGQILQLCKEGEQREMEKKNLELAIAEAAQAANVAVAQVVVAEAALTVSNLQSQAALMRLDFALDNYEFLRNRLISAEMWFRLAHAVREVANTYLRRAIEMSFLAEQVYEFMINKRINVIRFDYDNDELGAMLGADYLKADLDYLESHLIFTQKERQQKLKCIISMARDFPQALQELNENESAIIPITLEYLERRFPGVHNIKVSAVELQPIAIMDPTKFSVEMTFMGSGSIRTKTYPVNDDGSGETTVNDFGPYGTAANPWIPNADTQFPVKSMLCPVETCVFTGLTLGEDVNFQSFSTQQKKAFEDCPASAGWLVDMSQTENRVVPGSLADMVITFYLTGFYDSDLKTHVDQATANETKVVNKIMSARNQFSDQYFSFERTGKIEFNITPNLLSVNERIGELKQLGAYFMPATTDINYTRFSSQEITKFRISNANNLSILESAPSFRIKKKSGGTNKKLTLTIQLLTPLDLAIGDKVEIFTDESSSVIPNSGTTRQREGDISLTKQGRHIITVRVTQGGKMNEHRMEVFISDSQPPILPHLVLPVIDYDHVAKEFLITSSRLDNADNIADSVTDMNVTVLCLNKDGKLMFQRSAADPSDIDFSLNPVVFAPSSSKNFTLKNVLLDPDDYFLITVFTLPVQVSNSSNQKQTPVTYDCMGNKLATNKGFTARDNAVSPPPTVPVQLNAFTNDLLGSPVSPLDNWKFDLSVNGFITSYDCNGNPTVDLTVFRDVMLFMEFELKRRIG